MTLNLFQRNAEPNGATGAGSKRAGKRPDDGTCRPGSSNAYKYSPDGRAIDLVTLAGTLSGKTEVDISVRDYGIGITPAQVAKIFGRFYRVDTSGAISGTGLGMSLVKEIMEAHQGRVEIKSTPNQGTQVIL